MNDTNNDRDVWAAWSVGPPKKTARGRKALRIALIVAAVGAAAAGTAVVIGRKFREDILRSTPGIIVRPIPSERLEPVRIDGDMVRPPRPSQSSGWGVRRDGGDYGDEAGDELKPRQ